MGLFFFECWGVRVLMGFNFGALGGAKRWSVVRAGVSSKAVSTLASAHYFGH